MEQQSKNHLSQTVGEQVPNWNGVPRPPRTPMLGRFCRIEPFSVEKHAADLHEANSQDTEGRMWTWMFTGPFKTFEEYHAWALTAEPSEDPLFHAIIDLKSGKAIGVASYLRIDPKMGSIEVGHIAYSPLLQRTPIATEAMYLMMRRVFEELGYRRYEWKCDSTNNKSCAAAKRYGFTFEGIFRQAVVYKGRNRDTAWYAMIDKEWPKLKIAYEQWLADDNFDADGHQRVSLSELTKQALSPC